MTTRKEPAAPPHLFEGQEFDLTIDKLAFGGQALGRVAGFVVFVEHALPGQTVRAKLLRKKARFAEARVVEVLEQSPAYQPPFCPHFGLCGGCHWQDLAYEEQLRWKGLHVQECLQHLAGLRPGLIRPTVASPRPRHYRNKMEFTFAPRAWVASTDGAAAPAPAGRGCALGLHVGADARHIFNLEHCFLPSAQSAAMVGEVRRWCGESRLPAYDPKTRRGFWRFLVIREGQRTSATLAHIITTSQGDGASVNKLASHLQERFPALTTLVHSRSDKKAQTASGEASRTLFGPGYIEEELAGLRFRISAHSFFQPNTLAAEGLYSAIRQLGEFTGQETVWDLYCGAGGIGLSVASQVRRVVGFEVMAAALTDAAANCRLNGLDNCRFLAGDLKERLLEVKKSGSHPLPDLVITDPPRSGMHPQVVQALKELFPRRIIYVSCNPATLARDLALLKAGYEVSSIQPFDFFPHTPHIECLVSLEKRPGIVW